MPPLTKQSIQLVQQIGCSSFPDLQRLSVDGLCVWTLEWPACPLCAICLHNYFFLRRNNVDFQLVRVLVGGKSVANHRVHSAQTR